MSDPEDGWTKAPGGGMQPPPIEMEALHRLIGRQQPGAIYNGRRIRKVNSEPGDRTPDGTEGTVLGSIGTGNAEIIKGNVVHYGYVIQWDGDEIPCFTVNLKVEEL